MAKITVLAGRKKIADPIEVKSYLERAGVTFDYWQIPDDVRRIAVEGNPSDEAKAKLLDMLAEPLGEVKRAKGCPHADVVVLNPGTPGLDEALAKFDRVHMHTDDEVRLVLDGEGIFGFSPDGAEEFELEIHAGEFISLPAGMWHWFTLTDARRIVAVRLFEDTDGWTPHYRADAPGTH